MANAIKRISTRRGHDIRDYALQCFGGAGGQHACDVADALGMRSILVHPLAGVLSAYGMGLAERRALRGETVEVALAADAMAGLERRAASLGEAARRRGDATSAGLYWQRLLRQLPPGTREHDWLHGRIESLPKGPAAP